MKHKIANVIEEGRIGGPQIRMVRTARAASTTRTIIIMPDRHSTEFRKLCELNEVEFRELPITRLSRDPKTLFRYLLFSVYEVIRLAVYFRRQNFELVHVSGGSWQYKGVVAARLARIPAVWHLNDSAMPKPIKFLFYMLSPLVSGFIFASYRSREYYRGVIGERPYAVIPSTVDPALFDPSGWGDKDSCVVPKFGHARVVGTVANVNPVKGLETFIRAAAACLHWQDDIQFVVVGPVYENQAKYHRRLLALAEELGVANAIHWLGSQSDVRPILARMNVYVCSSLAESSPLSVWEAMAMSRPVVSTDVGDVPVHIRDGESGYVVPVGDHEAIAERVVRILDDTALASEMGELARAEVKAEFSPEAVADKTEEVYGRVLEYSKEREG